MNLNKSEFIALVAEKTDLSKADAERAVNAYHEVIGETLAKGGQVTLTGHGTYKVSARAARQGRNPRTGETINIPASKSAVFKAGKALKDEVNK